MKTIRHQCLICDTLHDSHEDAALCCPDVEEVLVDEDCCCEIPEECQKGCFDRFPAFPKRARNTSEYVKEYEIMNRLKGSPCHADVLLEVANRQKTS